jgi:hypothetical protein
MQQGTLHMKTLLIAAVLGTCCLLAGANTSSAADHGQVPAKMLAEMGLAGMQPMSDVQGLAIRGMGRSRSSVYANVVVIVVKTGDANGGDGGPFGGGAGGPGGTSGDGTVTIKPFGIIQVINVRR